MKIEIELEKESKTILPSCGVCEHQGNLEKYMTDFAETCMLVLTDASPGLRENICGIINDEWHKQGKP